MSVVYEHIARNKRRSLIVAAAFPFLFSAFSYAALWAFFVLWRTLRWWLSSEPQEWAGALESAAETVRGVGGEVTALCFAAAVLWALFVFKSGDQVLLALARGASAVNRRDAYDAYTALENVSIAAGMLTPQLYVLEDDSLNAFAVGMSPLRSAVVCSSGLIRNLNRAQLEAVMAHEVARISQYDTRLMTVVATCLAVFTLAGEDLFYGIVRWGKNLDLNAPATDKVGAVLLGLVFLFLTNVVCMFAGAMLMVFGYVLAPCVGLALSRTRILLADAQAVWLTRRPEALESALRRICRDSRIEALDGQSLLQAMCIERPQGEETFFERISGLYRVHPPLEERIRALRDMDGRN